MVEESGSKAFDVSKYQVVQATKDVTVTIEETGEELEITIKQLSWSRRNQLLSKCLNIDSSNNSTSFNGDLYVRECLKEMIVDAPWGRTTEAFLVSIDERLGGALEKLVPNAFAGGDGDPDAVKKE